MTRKLYRVTLKGLACRSGSGQCYGEAYVVAEDPTAAYQQVKSRLESDDIGFEHDRELDTVQLIAEETDDPLCGHRLYIAPPVSNKGLSHD
jgi:hypothetical protein